jgi:hypothetical protein
MKNNNTAARLIMLGAAALGAHGAHAAIIDNGTLLRGTGGSCSSCSDLDRPNYINYDDLQLDAAATLNQIDFELVLYTLSSGPTTDTSHYDFRIDIWDATRSTNYVTWDFTGADVLSATWLGERAWSFSYDLGDIVLDAGDYLIGIGGDFSAHPIGGSFYTAGATSDGTYLQYNVQGGNLLTSRAGDLPYRLTINEAMSVPAPPVLALFGLGLAGLGLSRRLQRG